jgi:rhodanese-related sulfurtransferase
MSQRIFVDVREEYEYGKGHIDGALNVPPADLMVGAPQLQSIDTNTEIILYCVSGSRSNSASHILRQLGYRNLINGINKEQVHAKYGVAIVADSV